MAKTMTTNVNTQSATDCKSGDGDAGLLTITDGSDLLRVPAYCVYEQTRSRTSNRIPGYRLGKYWRFDRQEIHKWLQEQSTANQDSYCCDRLSRDARKRGRA